MLRLYVIHNRFINQWGSRWAPSFMRACELLDWDDSSCYYHVWNETDGRRRRRQARDARRREELASWKTWR